MRTNTAGSVFSTKQEPLLGLLERVTPDLRRGRMPLNNEEVYVKPDVPGDDDAPIAYVSLTRSGDVVVECPTVLSGHERLSLGDPLLLDRLGDAVRRALGEARDDVRLFVTKEGPR